MIRLLATFLLGLFAIPSAQALGPHELVVLVRQGDTDSQEIADLYAGLRGIPPSNIIPVALPKRIGDEISLGDFRERVFKPALGAMIRRGLHEHILAVAYSSGFPTRVKTDSGLTLSLTGATFAHGKEVNPEQVLKGQLYNPIFAAPAMPGQPAVASRSLDAYQRKLKMEMPLCSMMLGVVRKDASSGAEVKAALVRSKSADATRPPGTVFFYDTDDVRSTARDWQYEPDGAVVEGTRDQS